MQLKIFESQDEIADLRTDDIQHYPDPHTTEGRQFFDPHVPTTLYGPIHLLDEPQNTFASDNGEKNQLITDKDDSNIEATMPETRHTNTTRRPRHAVVPYIRPTHTTDVKPSLESPTTSSHTEPVTTPNHIDSPHQPTNPTLAPSPTIKDNNKPHPT